MLLPQMYGCLLCDLYKSLSISCYLCRNTSSEKHSNVKMILSHRACILNLKFPGKIVFPNIELVIVCLFECINSVATLSFHPKSCFISYFCSSRSRCTCICLIRSICPSVRLSAVCLFFSLKLGTFMPFEKQYLHHKFLDGINETVYTLHHTYTYCVYAYISVNISNLKVVREYYSFNNGH